MCGHKRALRYQQQMNLMNGSLLAGTTPLVNGTRGGPITSLIGAVSNMALKSDEGHTQYRNSTPTPALAPALAPAPAYTKAEKAEHTTDEPPAYERVAAGIAPEVATREMSQSTYNTVDKQHSPSKLVGASASSPQVARLIEALIAATTAHQAGFGRRKHIRKAQRALRNELYESEVARRQAMYGRLRCGEKCEIWREVKAMNLGY